MKRNVIFVLICMILLAGCSDFLEEESNELTYARSCKDLEEVLIGSGYMKNIWLKSSRKTLDPKSKDIYYPWLHVMDDDVQAAVAGVENTTSSLPLYQMNGFYCWEKDPFNIAGISYADPTWSKLYLHIASVNLILSKAEEFTHDNEDARNSVKGQSHFLRAAYYFLLVNFYAKPYDPITASEDLGVPLKLSPVVEDKNFTRTPVDSVYNQIVSDLKMAISELEGITMKTYNRANEDAARILLSRVYCYMGKWELVPELCREVLKRDKYELRDLTHGDVKTWLSTDSPEIVFTQGTNTSDVVYRTQLNNATISSFRISDEMKEVMKEEEDDCRLGVLSLEIENDYTLPRKLTGTDTTSVGTALAYISDCFLIRLPEVYLNLAEALAMTGQEGEARVALKTLMDKRIKSVRPLTESGKKLIDLVRTERRRELCYEGHRWFDLRRYAVCPNYPEAKTIRHNVYEFNAGGSKDPGQLIGYYLLPAYPDGGWVLPIPSYDIEETDGALKNNERENCIFYER